MPEPNATPQSPEPRPQSAAPGLPAMLRSWARDLTIATAIAGFIILFLYQPVKVEGNSMQPNLEDQERIFINKFVYRLEAIAHGDVVVFRYPRDPSKSYIKRVVGVPGDRIRVAAGRVYLNGQMLREDYVSGEGSDLRSYPEVVVPAGSYYVMGDHRLMSNDSREFGPVHARFIYGKAVFVYWPVERAGTLH
ncbi:MAG: signal peptidase I [Terriglobales bacterium]